jgi:hypothetical protein
MGKLFVAVREGDHFRQRVALKVLRVEMDNQSDRSRFALERQLLSALNHPNIARLLDAGETDDGRPYFAMEFVEGTRLDKFCDSQRYSVTERLRLLIRICAAVSYAHANLIVHRDLKPGNILVTPAGEPKLLDFGIAKLLNADISLVPHLTRGDRRFLTPEYASPEQARGEPITTASDVYSLGVILYELLTGRLPCSRSSGTPDELLEFLKSDREPERPSLRVLRHEEATGQAASKAVDPEEVARVRERDVSHLRSRLEGDIDNIVLKALRKVPRERYESAQQFAADIARHLDGLPVEARSPTWTYRTGKFVRRHRVGVLTAGSLAAGLVAVTVAMTALAREASRQRASAEDQLAITRSVINTLSADVQRSAELTEAGTAARLALATTVAAGLEELDRKLPKDPGVQRELARAYLTLADVRGSRRAGSEGNFALALEYCDLALARVAALHPVDDAQQLELQRLRAAGLLRRADALLALADPAHARAYEDALEAAERLAAAPGHSVADARFRIAALASAGEASSPAKDEATRARADKLLELSVELAQELRDAYPGDAGVARDAAVSQMKLSEHQLAKGLAAKADARATQALAILVPLASRAASASAHRDVMTAHELRARILLTSGPASAAEATREAHAAAETALHLASDDPVNWRAVWDAARTSALEVECSIARGDLEGALGASALTASLAGRLLTFSPRNVELASDLCERLLDRAITATAQSQFAQARACLECAATTFRRIDEQVPGNAAIHERLAFVDESLKRLDAR